MVFPQTNTSYIQTKIAVGHNTMNPTIYDHHIEANRFGAAGNNA